MNTLLSAIFKFCTTNQLLKEMIILKDAVCNLMMDLKMDDIVVFVGELNGHVGKRSDDCGEFHRV